MQKQNLKEGGLSSPLKLWDHEAHAGIRYMIYGFRPMTFQMPQETHSYPNYLSISHEAYQINTPKKYQFFYRLAGWLALFRFFHLIITKLKYNWFSVRECGGFFKRDMGSWNISMEILMKQCRISSNIGNWNFMNWRKYMY